MKLLRSLGGSEFQKAPSQIDSLFNHEIHHFFPQPNIQKMGDNMENVCIVMLDQKIWNFKPLRFQRDLLS